MQVNIMYTPSSNAVFSFTLVIDRFIWPSERFIELEEGLFYKEGLRGASIRNCKLLIYEFSRFYNFLLLRRDPTVHQGSHTIWKELIFKLIPHTDRSVM